MLRFQIGCKKMANVYSVVCVVYTNIKTHIENTIETKPIISNMFFFFLSFVLSFNDYTKLSAYIYLIPRLIIIIKIKMHIYAHKHKKTYINIITTIYLI